MKIGSNRSDRESPEKALLRDLGGAKVWEYGHLGRSLPREWKHEVGKMGTGAASSHAVCVLHKGFG